MSKYANIIVDISHEKLDKTFQYRVPDELEDVIKIGVAVDVPFGNRQISGYVVELTDELNIDFDLPTSNQFTEIISGLKLNNISVAGFKDSIVLFETMTKQDVSFNCTQYTEFVEDNLQLKTAYVYASNEESIDVGKLSSVEVKTDDKKSIESVVIENG